MQRPAFTLIDAAVLGELRLDVNEDGTVDVKMRMSIALQWDNRELYSSECFAALPSVVSLAEVDAQNPARLQDVRDAAGTLFHLPHAELRNEHGNWPMNVATSRLQLVGSTPYWRRVIPRNLSTPSTDDEVRGLLVGVGQSDGNATCEHCVVYDETRDVTLQQQLDYVNFPFDRHYIDIEFSVATGLLVGCEQIANKLTQAAQSRCRMGHRRRASGAMT